jgi:WD40 repeat protein
MLVSLSDIFLLRCFEELPYGIYDLQLVTSNLLQLDFSMAGEFVASGSDDGRWFIWSKKTGRLIKMLNGDENGL